MTATTHPADYARYPEERASRYVEAGLWGTQRIETLIRARASENPSRPAITDADHPGGPVTLTRRELDDVVHATAAYLLGLGLRPEQTVLLQLPNSLDSVALTLALLRLRVRPVLVLPAHRRTELEHFAAVSGADVHLVGDLPGVEGATLSRELPGVRTIAWPAGTALSRPLPPHPLPLTEAGADDLAFFQLSGGSTGPSKLIPRAHREYAYSFLRSNELCGVGEDTVLFPALPMNHNFPLSSPGWFGVLAAGGRVVTSGAQDGAAVGALLKDHAVTHVQVVPPLVHAWLDDPLAREGFASVRRLLVGGARLAPAVAARAHRELAALQQVYGMAEGLVCYTDLDADTDTVEQTQGRPLSAWDELRLVDATGREVGPGEEGELQVRGPYTICSYYRAPEQDAAAFTADGFYKTGDLVRLSPGGDVRVVGRVKEQINRGGEKVSPAEVESLLLRHPGVADVKVLGVPDEFLGERVIARVMARPGHEAELSTAALRRHLRESSIAAFKIPDRFELVADLGTTAVGKLDRRTSALDVAVPGLGGSADSGEPLVLDLIGVGFGPANMALAAALEEAGWVGAAQPGEQEPGAARAIFLDAAEETAWHPGMLFEDASLQVCFAKDLVTFRNPTSPLSFLSFLADRGRMHDFFNRGSSAPLRLEFIAYLRWAEARLAGWVSRGERVTAVTPIIEDGEVRAYDVTSLDAAGRGSTRRARNVVLAAGLQPQLPGFVPEHPSVFHSAHYLQRIAAVGEVRKAVVVGGGQSAAEVALELRSRFPEATVHLVHSRFGLAPADSTPFVNRIFDQPSVDRLFNAPEEVRARLGREHANTNNSVVHERTIQALYDAWYIDSWADRERLVFHDVSAVRDVTAGPEGELRVDVEHLEDGTRASIDADVVVCGTGYAALEPASLMGNDAAHLLRDAQGRVLARRDYSLTWDLPAPARCFAVGITGHQHGISATLLSNIALRAGEVAAALELALEAQRSLPGVVPA